MFDCFYMSYDEEGVQTTQCKEDGLLLRIAVDDLSGEEVFADDANPDPKEQRNEYPIKEPAMFMGAEITVAGAGLKVMSTDSAVVKFWIEGEQNPIGV